MTYEQAEAIAILEFVPEMLAFVHEQQRILAGEMDAQCGRGRTTLPGDFLYFSGLLEGLRRASFTAILSEVKVLIKKKNEEERQLNER